MPRCFPPWCPAGTPASPESPFVSLMTVVFRMRASPPTSPPPSSPPRALHCHALLLSCSQDDRDAHQLCSREGHRPQRRSLLGRLFPGWDQDCLRIARREDQSLGFRCAGALQIAPPWPKLTLAGLSGRQTGAFEREDQRLQPTNHISGVFPGRDQDRVGIVGPDDQSLGFRCAMSPQIAPSWPKL